MLNKTLQVIRVGGGEKSILDATNQGVQGELAIATDSGNKGKLLVCPETGNAFVSPVAGSSPTSITGSRGGNAALATLLTELASLGIIVDNTTA